MEHSLPSLAQQAREIQPPHQTFRRSDIKMYVGMYLQISRRRGHPSGELIPISKGVQSYYRYTTSRLPDDAEIVVVNFIPMPKGAVIHLPPDCQTMRPSSW